MEYCEVYKLKESEGYKLSHINFSVGRKKIAIADIQSKILYLSITYEIRVSRLQKKLIQKYNDYSIEHVVLI